MSHDTNTSSPPSPAPRAGPKEMEQLIRLAERGEPKALECLRRLIDDLPAVGRVLTDRLGDIAVLARDALVNDATGGRAALSAELMGRKIDELRAELAGPNPSPLERLVAERVALGWFDVNASDRRFVTNADRQARRNGANRRFLDACRTLAAIRKLSLPAIQVNVARQQVNVAGGALGGRGESEESPRRNRAYGHARWGWGQALGRPRAAGEGADSVPNRAAFGESSVNCDVPFGPRHPCYLLRPLWLSLRPFLDRIKRMV